MKRGKKDKISNAKKNILSPIKASYQNVEEIISFFSSSE